MERNKLIQAARAAQEQQKLIAAAKAAQEQQKKLLASRNLNAKVVYRSFLVM